MSFSRMLKVSALSCSLALLAACNGGGGGGGTGGGPVLGSYSNPYISVDAFVQALNSIEGHGQNGSYVELYTDETYRSMHPGQEDWFVIYDDKFNEHKAVSLQYVRSIVYYDYYSNNSTLASEFRAIESEDILSGNVSGDFYGDDYEVVDYDQWTNSFWGRRSGYEYEDEATTTDTSLMTAELQQREFFKKAANISYAFSISLESAMSLQTIADKYSKRSNERTAADDAALTADLQHLTGVTLADVVAASQSQKAKEELAEKVADRIGTSAANLQNRILPELFNAEL